MDASLTMTQNVQDMQPGMLIRYPAWRLFPLSWPAVRLSNISGCTTQLIPQYFSHQPTPPTSCITTSEVIDIMDPSRENLLNGADRSSIDGSDAESDIDATDYLPKNTTTTQSGGTSRIRPGLLRRWRTRKCCLIIVGTAIVIWILISAIGAFAWNKIKTPPVDGQSPPWYPSPKGGTSKNWEKSYELAAKLVGKMTLAEKAQYISTYWLPIRGNASQQCIQRKSGRYH